MKANVRGSAAGPAVSSSRMAHEGLTANPHDGCLEREFHVSALTPRSEWLTVGSRPPV